MKIEIGNLLALPNRHLTIDTVFTTPGSHLVLVLSDFDRSIYCKKAGRNIKGTFLGVLESGKYHTISTKFNQLDIQAPNQLGNYKLRFLPTEGHLVGRGSSHGEQTIVLLYFFHPSTAADDDYDDFRMNNGSVVRIFYQVRLNIEGSLDDFNADVYKCKLYIHTLEIMVSKLHFLNQTDNNIIYGQEGSSTNISCTAVKGYEVGELLIYQYERELATSNNGIVTFSFVANRHSISHFYCTENSKPEADIHVKLVVNYAPDVKVSSRENSIDCYPNGFPDTYTFHRWEHQSEKGEHVRFLGGLNNGTLILRNIRMQYQKSGIYVCTVSNGIPDINGSILQTGFTYFSYKGPPIFVNENTLTMNVDLYQPLTVSFFLYSNPTVGEIWIEGVASNYTKNETVHCFRISETKLKYTELGSNKHIKGKQIAFELKMFSSEYEMYRIWTKNGMGEASTTFRIRAVGAPIFLPENRNVTHGELGNPLTLAFLVYSDPIVEDVWIEDVGTERNLSRTKYEFQVIETTLPYTAFGNKGNISGCEIIIEINILSSNELQVYNILAKNQKGFVSYRFEIITAEFAENNGKSRERFITSSSIAAVLLVYIIVIHIYICVRQKTNRTRRGSIPQSLRFNTYDEIESLSYEFVNVRGIFSDQQGPILQTSVIHGPQDESYTNNYRTQLTIDGHEDTSSQSTVQEPQVNEHDDVRQNNISEAEEVEASSVLSFDDIFHSVESYGEEAAASAGDSLQSSQSSGHQDDHLSNSVYENSYQPVIRESQDTHQYSVIFNKSAEIDSDRSTPATVKPAYNVPDYVNLRF
ncbi:unnamed protein product [Mytilus coruscus]|uniref:Ig-like domain-containing protein n=1 Tax=Mytilus coruscus TaxID=42192 RepID=A0A6J8ERU5_MYTCO|nr:unnamed protein product [Mytilus coruscus]